MDQFVRRIGDVTIERVLPKSKTSATSMTPFNNKEPTTPRDAGEPKKRPLDTKDDYCEGLSVSKDLKIFIKQPPGAADNKRTESGSESRLKDVALGVGLLSSSGKSTKGPRDESDDDSDEMSTDGDDESDEDDSDSDNEKLSALKVRFDKTPTGPGPDAVTATDEAAKPESADDVESAAEADRGADGEPGAEAAATDAGKEDEDDGGDEKEPEPSDETSAGKRKSQSDSGGESSSGRRKKKKKRSAGAEGGAGKGDEASKSGAGSSASGSGSDDDSGSGSDNKSTMERKLTNMRRNIREVMNENQLDEETLAAQRREMERLRRVQDQQRILREVQRQMALNKQNNKTQTRVISLLQGNSSILKQIPGTSASASGSSGSQVRLPNTVLVKLAPGGATTAQAANKKVFELLRVQKGAGAGRGGPRPTPGATRTLLAARQTGHHHRPLHMMTPSVSIAPVPHAARGAADTSDDEDEAARAALRKVAGKPKTKGKVQYDSNGALIHDSDVVTISSSSEDDCILLSEPSSSDEADPGDDPTNSGMHTNDLYNVPDEQGRVLVNVGHPGEEKDVFLAPQIARVIKPHQIGGIRFLYDNVIESIDRFDSSTGFGCILAHSMGLGKTLQLVSFCDIFLRHTPARTVLCILPINTVQNWLAEFNMWLPATDPQSPQGEVRPRNFSLHVLNDSHKSLTARAKVIHEWNKDGGVLLMGYELYRQFSLKRSHRGKKRSRPKMGDAVDVDDDDKTKAALDEILASLVKPGPDLVICDEGHRIKNSHASISQALKQIRSKRRIVLTGYPLQNNLLEYWCMVDFVRPNYLGTKTEFCNMFERPIQNGQCYDSTPQDVRLMRYRAHVLHSLLEGFVQRRSQQVLQVSLPQKEEYVLLLRMTEFQRKLYDTFMNEVVRTKAVPNPLKAFAVCCKIWNHPDVLFNFLKKRAGGEAVDLDLEEATAAALANTATPTTAMPASGRGRRGRGRTPRATGATRRDKKTPFANNPGNKPAATITPSLAPDSTVPLPGMNQMHSGYGMAGGGYGSAGGGAGQPYDMGGGGGFPGQQFPTPTPGGGAYNPDGGGAPYNMGFGAGDPGAYPDCGGDNSSAFGGGSGGGTYPYPNSSSQSQFGSYYGGGSRGPNDFSDNANQGANNYWHGTNQGFYQGGNPASQGGANNYQQNGAGFEQGSSGGANYQANPGTQSGGSFTQNPGAGSQLGGTEGFPPGGGAGGYRQGYPSQSQGGGAGFQQSAATNQYYEGGGGGGGGFGGNYFMGQGYGYGSGVQGQDPYNMGQSGYMGGQQKLVDPTGGTMGPHNPDAMQIQNAMDSAQNPLTNPQSGQVQIGNNPMAGGPDGAMGPMVPPQNQQSAMGAQQSQPPLDLKNLLESSQNLMPNAAMDGTNNVANPSAYSAMGGVNNNPYSQQNPTGLGPYQQQHMGNNNNNNPGSYQGGNNAPGYPGTSPQVKLEAMLGMDCVNPYAGANSGNNNGNNVQPFAGGHMGGSESNSWNADFGGLKLEDGGDKTKEDSKGFMDFEATTGSKVGSVEVKVEKMDYPKSALDSLKEEFSSLDKELAGEKSTGVVDPSPTAPATTTTTTQQQQGYKMEGDAPTPSKEGDASDPTKPDADGKDPTKPDAEREDSPDKKESGDEKPASEPSDGKTVAAEGKELGTESPTTVTGAGEKVLDVAAVKNSGREDPGIPYDWAVELLKNYVTGDIENSAKMAVFFCILEESMALGDRILVFSQSLFTLNLIEDFLQSNRLPGREEKWARNVNYYRLDGSTAALEREKLINEYNSNPNIHLFLVSTRAGSLGINLVGANRVIVFDASWNPCHDTQAVCRVYRYGQKKPCFVYRLVMDNCLEKKIYDRQINKQGMADRVVDECNPDAHLSIKEVTNLCWDDEKDSEVQDFSANKEKYIDVVMQKMLAKHSKHLSKEPFQHESLLVDRKEKKLSQAEKRLAQRSYELEKQANIHHTRPYYPATGGAGIQPGLHIRAIRTDGTVGVMPKPVASVRPMQSELGLERGPGGSLRSSVTAVNTGRTRWIPADVWQRQGMSAQEMTLPLDVVIPTNSADRASIVLKAGQRVMVLKSPKGIYMQLENGKIIAIRTAFKVGGAGKNAGQDSKTDLKTASFLSGDKADDAKVDMKKEGSITLTRSPKVSNVLPLRNNPAITIIPKNSPSTVQRGIIPTRQTKQESLIKPWGAAGGKAGTARQRMLGKMVQPTGEAKPYFHQKAVAGKTGEAKPFFHHSEGSNDNEEPGAVPRPGGGEDRDENTKSSASSSNANDFARNLDEMDLDSEMSYDEGKVGGGDDATPKGFLKEGADFRPHAGDFATDMSGDGDFQSEVQKMEASLERMQPEQKRFPGEMGKFQQDPSGKFQQEHSSKFQQEHSSKFQQEHSGKFQQDPSGKFQQEHSMKFQDPSGKFQQEHMKFQQDHGKFQQDPSGKFQQEHSVKFQDPSGKFQQEHMKFQQDHGKFQQDPSGKFQQEHSVKFQDPSGKFQQEHGKFQQEHGKFQQDPSGKFQQDPSAKFQQEHSGKFQQEHGKFQQEHSGKFQQEHGKFQQDLSGKFQQDPSAKFQQDHGGKFQQDLGVKFQQEQSAKFSQDHSAKFQQDTSAKFSQDHSGKFQPDHGGKFQQDPSGKFQQDLAGGKFPTDVGKGAQAAGGARKFHMERTFQKSGLPIVPPDPGQGWQQKHAAMQQQHDNNSFPLLHPSQQQGGPYPGRSPGFPPPGDFAHHQHHGMQQNPQSRIPDPSKSPTMDSSDDDQHKMLSPPSEILLSPPPPSGGKSSLKSYRHNFTHSLGGGGGRLPPSLDKPETAREADTVKEDEKADLFPVVSTPTKTPRSQANYVPNLTPRNPAAKKARAPKNSSKNAPVNYQAFGSTGEQASLPKAPVEKPFPPAETAAPPPAYQHPHYAQHFGAPGYGGYGFGNSYYGDGQYPPPYQMPPQSGVPPPPHQNVHGGGGLPPPVSQAYQGDKMAAEERRPQPTEAKSARMPELPQYGLSDKNLHLGLGPLEEDEDRPKPARKDSADSLASTGSEGGKKDGGKGERGAASPESNSHSGNNSARSTPLAANPPPAVSGDPALQYSSPLPGNYPSYPPAAPPHQNPYDMMMNTYPPPPHQYNAGPPGAYRPPVPNPYPAAGGYPPMGYPPAGGGQYDADYARASMYSAFHRPEPHHFPPPGDLSSPFLPTNNSSPFLPPHHRFPTPNPAPPPQNPNYYPQNMYAPPYGARPAYGATDPAYNPYGSAPGFNPFLNPHLAPPIHQGYPGIPPAQNSPAPPTQ